MTTNSAPSKRGNSNSNNDSFAALQLSIQRPGHEPQTFRLCFHSGWPSLSETISLHFDGRDDTDRNTSREANTIVNIGLGDAAECQGSIRCMLLSPDSESVHNGGCCLQDSPPASSPKEAETQHPELKRRRPGTSQSKGHQADDSLNDDDDGDDGETSALPVKRRRCSSGSFGRSIASMSTLTAAPEYNCLVHLGLVKLYPTEHDVILNRLQPSVIHRSRALTPQQRLLWPLTSYLRWFGNLTRLRSIPLRVAACAALVVGLAALLRALPHLPLARERLSQGGHTHASPSPPVRHLDLLALYSANLVRYASVPRILSLGFAARSLHELAGRHAPEPPAFACNSAGHFVPEEYFLSDLRLVLPDVIWDLRRNSGSTADARSSSADDNVEDGDKTAPSLAALQEQVSRVLSRLTILNGKIRAFPKNWSSDVFLASSSRLLELVEVRKREPDVTVSAKYESPVTTPATLVRPDWSRLAEDADVPESFSSVWAAYMIARSERRSPLHTPTPPQPSLSSSTPPTDSYGQDRINSTHQSLLKMARRPIVTVNLDIPGEAAPGHHDHGYAKVPREQVLVLYAAVLDEAYALLSDIIARVNQTVAVVPDPIPPTVTPDEGMRSLLDNPSQYGIARIHRAAPFLRTIALARLADMRDRARSAVLVLRDVVAHQSPPIDPSSSGDSSSSTNSTVSGPTATFPGWPIIAVDMEFVHQWIRAEYEECNLATKMRQVNFMAGIDEIESEDEGGRTPEGLVWSRWNMEDDREDPYMRERLFWWQRRRREVPGRRSDGGALGKVPGVIRNWFS
ncbi:GTPase-activator protein for Ras-like GTPase containing protein [Colletotrichum asianum]